MRRVRAELLCLRLERRPPALCCLAGAFPAAGRRAGAWPGAAAGRPPARPRLARLPGGRPAARPTTRRDRSAGRWALNAAARPNLISLAQREKKTQRNATQRNDALLENTTRRALRMPPGGHQADAPATEADCLSHLGQPSPSPYHGACDQRHAATTSSNAPGTHGAQGERGRGGTRTGLIRTGRISSYGRWCSLLLLFPL